LHHCVSCQEHPFPAPVSLENPSAHSDPMPGCRLSTSYHLAPLRTQCGLPLHRLPTS
jgi:hypothetical protein